MPLGPKIQPLHVDAILDQGPSLFSSMPFQFNNTTFSRRGRFRLNIKPVLVDAILGQISNPHVAAVPAQRSIPHNHTQQTIDLKTTTTSGTMYRYPITDRGHSRPFRTFNNGPRAPRNPPRRRCNRTTQITLEPRPFQELHQEREELLRALNAEDDRALALYQRLVYCDDKIKCGYRQRKISLQNC